MSSLSVLYERPISQAVVAEWRRNRERYEREVKKYAPKPVVIVAPKPKPKPQSKPKYRGPFSGRTKFCQCGCGGETKYHGTLWLPGHRPLMGRNALPEAEIEAQLARIPDTELGRLCKEVLLKELGRA